MQTRQDNDTSIQPTMLLHLNSLSRHTSWLQSRHMVVSWSSCRLTRRFLYTQRHQIDTAPAVVLHIDTSSLKFTESHA